MQIEKGYIYHIYNQGNNRQKIFFERENYLFFLAKIKTYILPYGDILAWCLMPNHFHLMVLINETELFIENTHPMTSSHRMSVKPRTINNSIAIMLRSYTRAIQKQENITGSVFRQKTKAECVNCPSGITPSFITENNITKINVQNPEEQYSQVCFNYIHENPVKAKLVKNVNDWQFSSAKDYMDIRDGKLVNKTVAYKYVRVF